MNANRVELSPERALARQIWRERIAEMIADNSKSLMRRVVDNNGNSDITDEQGQLPGDDAVFVPVTLG